ncbi:MAG: hypothetical protein IT444_00385 [Phycisphaeraceae bacterium]|nr:hypothetical protein [Phycisphaeraceae bacterium]
MLHEEHSDRPTLLLAGIDPIASPTPDAFICSTAHDAGEVLHYLRARRTDLLLLGLSLRGTSFAVLMRRARLVHPQQRWALVAPVIDADIEIEARALGAMTIFDGPPSPTQLREVLDKIRSSPAGQLPTSSVRIRYPRPPGKRWASTFPRSPGD